MKTNILPGFLKLLSGLLVTTALIILLLAYVQTVQSLIASVGWHDMASVGWHDFASVGWHDMASVGWHDLPG